MTKVTATTTVCGMARSGHGGRHSLLGCASGVTCELKPCERLPPGFRTVFRTASAPCSAWLPLLLWPRTVPKLAACYAACISVPSWSRAGTKLEPVQTLQTKALHRASAHQRRQRRNWLHQAQHTLQSKHTCKVCPDTSIIVNEPPAHIYL